MIGTNVIHDGKKAIILAEREFPMLGELLAIQYLKPNGLLYRVRERPEGFKQYVYVKPCEVVCCG